MKNRGIVTVSYGALENALHLPEAHRIIGIRLVDTFSDTFEIAVEGPTLPPVDENTMTPRVRCEITVTEDREKLVPARTFITKFL